MILPVFNLNKIQGGMHCEDRENQGHEKNIEYGNHTEQCRHITDSKSGIGVSFYPAYFFPKGPATLGGWIIEKHQGGVEGVHEKYRRLAYQGDESDGKGGYSYHHAHEANFNSFKQITKNGRE